MIERSKYKRENYPRKWFWTQERETRVKHWSAFEQLGPYDEREREPQGGVLRISIDGDDRRIFLGLKFSIPGFFWVRKFGKYFFG